VADLTAVPVTSCGVMFLECGHVLTLEFDDLPWVRSVIVDSLNVAQSLTVRCHWDIHGTQPVRSLIVRTMILDELLRLWGHRHD
jgi:hypothetical protein